MYCDLRRSIHVGLLSSFVLSLISYLLLPHLKKLDKTKLLFLFVVFFVIATSMDYFNYCFTKCKNVKSSITYGVFTVGLIYVFFTLFVGKLESASAYLYPVVFNVAILSGIHYFLCDPKYNKNI